MSAIVLHHTVFHRLNRTDKGYDVAHGKARSEGDGVLLEAIEKFHGASNERVPRRKRRSQMGSGPLRLAVEGYLKAGINQPNFAQMSHSVAKALLDEVKKNQTRSIADGYIYIAHYAVSGMTLLLVSIISNTNGLKIKEAGFELESIEHMDPNKYRAIAVLNLSSINDPAALSLTILEKGTETNYWSAFLKAEGTRSDAVDTETVIRAIETYVAEKQYSAEAVDRVMSKLYKQASDAAIHQEKFTEEIALSCFTEDEQPAVQEYFQEKNIPIDFTPHKQTVDSLSHIKRKVGPIEFRINKPDARNRVTAVIEDENVLVLKIFNLTGEDISTATEIADLLGPTEVSEADD